jgi:hypothetical protein
MYLGRKKNWSLHMGTNSSRSYAWGRTRRDPCAWVERRRPGAVPLAASAQGTQESEVPRPPLGNCGRPRRRRGMADADGRPGFWF